MIPASLDNAAVVESNLRPADFEEFVMSTGRNPKGLFRLGVTTAQQSYCGTVDGVPACIYGVTLDHDGVASPWFMGTPLIEGMAVAKAMLVYGRMLFRDWYDEFGPLRHYAYAKNELHIRYIEALGCEIKPSAPRGPFNAPFREFTYYV